MTPSRKEYLYQLSDLSENSHTAEYLAATIEKVINDIEEDRISAVVSDNAANVRLKCWKIIHENYPKIENVRCVAYSINLIACDIIVKEKFGDRLLKRVNTFRYEADLIYVIKYDEQDPFDLDIGYAKDSPMNWWKYINTESEPDVLPRVARYLFAICPTRQLVNVCFQF
jgi:hypothetical protein